MKTKRYFFGVLFCNTKTGRFSDVHGDLFHYDFVGAKEAVETWANDAVRKTKNKDIITFPPIITEVLDCV